MGDTDAPTESAVLAQLYSEGAVVYQKLWASQLRSLAAQLLAALPLPEARSVLDVGCGVGALLDDLASVAPRAHVVGIDRAIGMIRKADARHGRVVMDAAGLAFGPDSFDVVTMCFMLFHVPDPAAALREVARILRPGGSVGVITWGDDPSYPALDVWTDELDRHGAAPAEKVSTRHELVDTPSKVEALLLSAGCHPVHSWTSALQEGFDIEAFIEARTRLGFSKRRLESLDDASRRTCLARAMSRLEELEPEDFVDRSTAIFVVASKPESSVR
ncbi:MAG: methyltransferase domain-containing protein [Actinomycetota bacterium]